MPLRCAAHRVLIRCPNWIGDMVAATAAIRCMRRNYPDAHITLVLRPYVRPVVENAPWFDEIVEFDRHRGGLREILRAGSRLRHPARYDLALLLTHSFSSALLAWWGGARRRVGHARSGRSMLLTDPVPWPRKGRDFKLVAKVKLYSGLLEYLGCEGAREQRPELFTSEADERECERLLQHHGYDGDRPLVAIVPGAAYGSSKLWEPERFATVADKLWSERNLQPIILTGPGEEPIGREIALNMKSHPIAFRRGEVPFGALKGIVRRCALMVCNDTGPRHVAVAYNVPTVVIMGPTDPAVTDSDYERKHIVRRDVPCGPCYLRACPTDHRCMKLVTPDMVLWAAGDLLDRYGVAPAGKRMVKTGNGDPCADGHHPCHHPGD